MSACLVISVRFPSTVTSPHVGELQQLVVNAMTTTSVQMAMLACWEQVVIMHSVSQAHHPDVPCDDYNPNTIHDMCIEGDLFTYCQGEFADVAPFPIPAN
jgi:hypothetical protein